MMRSAVFWTRCVAIALFLVGLAACSLTRVAYNNVDTLIRWKADDYFSLDGDQQRLLKVRLDRTLAWHRSEELPRYSELLTVAAERVTHGLSRADIEGFLDEVRARYDAVALRLAPGAADVLCALKPVQIAHFEARVQRENERFAQEYVELPEADQLTKRTRRTLEVMEDWVGELTPAQATRMESLSRAIPLTNALRLADRERRQREFMALGSRCPSKDATAAAVAEWMINWDRGRAPEYDRLWRETREQTIAMVLELDRMLTPAQRVRAQEKALRHAETFLSLTPPTPAHHTLSQAAAALDASVQPRLER